MNRHELTIHFAASLLPHHRRKVRREEWMADLAGSSTLGFAAHKVSLGAIRYSIVNGLREYFNHMMTMRRSMNMERQASTGLKTVCLTLLVTIATIGTFGAVESLRNRDSGYGIAFAPGGEVFNLEVHALIASLLLLTLGLVMGAIHFRRSYLVGHRDA